MTATDYDEALAAALDEAGTPLLHVTCPRCSKQRKALGTVSQTSRGLLFRAEVIARDVYSQLPESQRKRMDTTGDKGPKYLVANLVDWPTVAWDPAEGARVWCHKHGVFVLDHSSLVAAARKAGASGRPSYMAAITTLTFD